METPRSSIHEEAAAVQEDHIDLRTDAESTKSDLTPGSVSGASDADIVEALLTQNNGPLYSTIIKRLLSRLESGALPVGSYITEVELCAEFSCSRTTARNAIKQLTDAGILAPFPGLGTRVQRVPDFGERHSLALTEPVLLRKLGSTSPFTVQMTTGPLKDLRVRFLGAGTLSPDDQPDGVRSVFDNEDLVFSLRIRLDDEKGPVAVRSIYLPACCWELANPARVPATLGGLYSFYQEQGKILLYADIRLRLAQIESRPAAELNVPEKSAVMVREQVAYARDGKPFECVHSLETRLMLDFTVTADHSRTLPEQGEVAQSPAYAGSRRV